MIQSLRFHALEPLFCMLVFTLCLAAPSRSHAQLPPGWTGEDIGGPALTGAASYADGIWTLTGAGNDIWNNSDQFYYAYEAGTENCVITAKVVTQDYTDPWAKAGVMIRDDNTGGSAFAMVVATPANGIAFQWRSTPWGGCGNINTSSGSVPIWVKLARSGTLFTGYMSYNGTSWSQIGQQDVGLSFPGLVGLAVTAHNEWSPCTATFSDVVVSNAPAPPPRVTGVYRELWQGLDQSIGNTLAMLTNTTYNPSWPDYPDPTYTRVLPSFEAPSNIGLDYYGQRLRAFVVPPTNGNYTFWIASDDMSQLFLSNDESPAHISSLASVAGWTTPRQWTREPNQQSAPVRLEAGRRYYIEAIQQDGWGDDNLAVRWQLPDGSFEEPLPGESDIGTKLLPFDGQETFPGVYAQTTNVTVWEGETAVVSVLSTNRAPLGYRWRVNGTPIAGTAAAYSVYAISNVTMAMNGNLYTCVLSNSLGTVVSTPARLSVIGDTNPPTLLRALNSGLTNVLIIFSEPVEAASATKPSNYVFTNGQPVSSAVIGAEPATVILTVSPLVLGSNYTISISGVRDQATTPNTIAPNSKITFGAMPYTPQDIGVVAQRGTAGLAGNGMDVTSWGKDIGGTADGFTFAYTIRTGDFDVATRLAGLSPSDPWAKAGLMARESLEQAGRFAATLATPAMVGTFFAWRDPAGSSSQSAGSFPGNYPYTWLRLKRAGNVFTGYASYDGQVWSQLGSSTASMASQVYFGLAVSSHSDANAAVAQFRDITDVSSAIVGTVNDPREPPGPSTRKTPLVFSEIMYKPGPRSDTNNLEFVEIYNSNPWFEDMSGYRLAGDSIRYTFPAGTVLRGGGCLVVAASPSSMRQVYGLTTVYGPYTNSLKKDSTLELRDERGSLLLRVHYDCVSPWPVAAHGAGHSLVLARPTYGEADPRAWGISDVIGGSPGTLEPFRPTALRNVVINEYLAHTDPPDVDYVELYNHSTQSVDISGCILTDDISTNRFIVPSNTVIQARSFISFTQMTLGFALNAQGESIYFLDPGHTRVLDAVQFDGQENGVATGRWPDGANDFYRLAAKTPGAPNAAIRVSDVVINELMYHPISQDDDDQYLELYNQGTSAVNLGGWTIDGGVRYTFPTNTILQSGGYVVIARNAARLRTNYANLNLSNCLGDFNGRLSRAGERIALTMPDTVVSTNSSGRVSTNLIHITVDEVTYCDGGRWGEWSDGGGSSLELINPRSNHRLASNWADSDETQKSSWASIEKTGVLDLGQNYGGSFDYAQIGLLETGECLVDNIEVLPAGSAQNLVPNPTFDSGLQNWSFQGSHLRSGEATPGYGSVGRCLKIRATERMWTGANSCQMGLVANSLSEGQTVTLRFQARWLRGWPEPMLRLNGNWLEATGRLPVPRNLGTPGARNSRFVSNPGPAIYEVTHTPALPAANQSVVVLARVHDCDAVQSLSLNYRIDPSTSWSQAQLKDDGSDGDAVAGDGVFSATIPAQPANTIVAFYLSATDAGGGATRFPAVMRENEYPPECVVRFGDANVGGCFPVYHLWITRTNSNRWSALSDLSNEMHDCTMVSGTRVIYNVRARFAGSPYHQGFNTPDGALCHYKWVFPDDDKFLGATSFNKLHQPGNGAGDDQSLQREQTANTFLRALGEPWLYRHLVAVYVNGVRRGTLMEDAQTPDADVVEQNFPDDPDGWLYKMQPWFEFDPFNTGGFNNCSWCNMMPYTTSDGTLKTARYRWMFMVRRTPVSANDYTNVFSMVNAASTYGQPNYVANMENMADMENWMRVFAANHAAGNWDAYGSPNSQNLYGYIGTKGTKYSLIMFDFNIVLGNSGSWGPGQNLFSGNWQDPNTQSIFNEPTFRRMYWRALEELVNGPLDTAVTGPLLDAKYNAMIGAGLNVENPFSIKSWMTSARNSIASQIAGENTSQFAVTGSPVVNNNIATFAGTAPVKVKAILFNGMAYPVTWTGVTTWKAAVPLQTGQNSFAVVGVDIRGQPIPGASTSASAAYAGTIPSPAGLVVINEIMHDPLVPGAEYVELYNSSSTTAFDLSGCEFRGLAYTFPSGAVIGPNSYLVLAANRAMFAAAYGVDTPVFDSFDNGKLQADGETLTLLRPGTNAIPDLIMAKVRYQNTAPWPTAANGTGNSLQVLDPRRDNWRVGNWSAGTATPGSANSVLTTLPAFAPLWLNEVQAENLTGPTNGLGQRVGWIEVYNPTTNTVPLGGVYLSLSYSNLGAWAFPSNAVVRPGEFKLVFTDGLTNLTTTNELHAGFVLPVTAGTVALSTFTNAQLRVLDFVEYNNLKANHSYGSFPDGQCFSRQEFVYVTPGTTNNAASSPIPISINEWMADNVTTRPDPADSNYEDWFELYNYGTQPVDLGGYYLTDNLTNKFQFMVPNNRHYVVPAAGFLLVWADGEAGQNSTNRPDLHVSFKLDKAGEAIGLFGADGTPVDTVTFGPQTNDVSQGRYPDGSASIFFMSRPSPGTHNVLPNLPPVLDALPDLTVFLGQTASFTAHASDPDVPAQSLTFSLAANAPAGAAINPSTGYFTWTPTAAPMASTFSVGVTDNGTPNMSAWRNCTITVLPVPQLGTMVLSGNKLVLTWTTVPGENYQVEYRSDLAVGMWSPYGQVIPGTGAPAGITNTVDTLSNAFYRVRILP